MRGPFYVDTWSSGYIANQGAVTLATTNKALIPASMMKMFPAGFWDSLGQKMKIRVFGVITTALTPGNGQFALYWGNGTDANGTIIGNTAAVALAASQTNIPFEVELVVQCRAFSAGGSLLVTGHVLFGESVVTPHLLVPGSGAPAGVAVDTSVQNLLSLQFNRSGSTVETATAVDWEILSLN